MAAVTIRNLSEEAHRALKVRAAQHNRSAESEMRAILEAAVRPEGRLRLGTALSEMSRKIGVIIQRSDIAVNEFQLEAAAILTVTIARLHMDGGDDRAGKETE